MVQEVNFVKLIIRRLITNRDRYFPGHHNHLFLDTDHPGDQVITMLGTEATQQEADIPGMNFGWTGRFIYIHALVK